MGTENNGFIELPAEYDGVWYGEPLENGQKIRRFAFVHSKEMHDRIWSYINANSKVDPDVLDGLMVHEMMVAMDTDGTIHGVIVYTVGYRESSLWRAYCRVDALVADDHIVTDGLRKALDTWNSPFGTELRDSKNIVTSR